MDWLRTLHSAEGLKSLVQAGGYPVLTMIIFAETGLLAGFFLPGDSLLVTAGIFAATNGVGGPGIFDIGILLPLLMTAAIAGDQVGYFLGRKAGPLIFGREDTFFFKKRHLLSAKNFYERHGGRALILARFVPIFRTFVPFVAGIAGMQYSRFLKVSIAGGVLWIGSMVIIGYKLGQSSLANELHKIILVVVFVSVLPLVFTVIKGYLAKKQNRT